MISPLMSPASVPAASAITSPTSKLTGPMVAPARVSCWVMSTAETEAERAAMAAMDRSIPAARMTNV